MTTQQKQAETQPADVKIVDVCDSCLLVAHDAGIHSAEAQDYAMREAGEVLQDHLCDAKEEPEYFQDGCGCGCYEATARRRAMRKQRAD